MAQSGDWISPRLYGEPWLEKPPLLFWLIGAGWKLGLRDEWAARLPIALLSIAFLAFFWWCLRREFGVEIATASTGILATCGGWLLYSHVAVTDVPLAATYSTAMLLAWRGRTRLAGVSLGLAVLAKALVPLALALPLLWWFRDRWRTLGIPLLLTTAVAAPWYAACAARHGRLLFDELIVRHHFARVFNAKAEVLHPQPFWFYVPVLILLLLPWTPLALAAHPRRLWADERTRFFVIWLGFGFLLFSLSSGKLPGYLLPLLPAAGVLLGISVVEAEHPRWWLAAAVAIAAGLYAAPNERLLEYMVRGPDAIPVSSLGLAVGLSAGAIAGWVAGGSFLRTVVAVALLMGGLRHWAAGIAERHTARPYAEIAGQICAEPGLHRVWRYGLSYYAQTEIPDCSAKLRRWRAGNSEFGLYLTDTSSKR
jgi:4-amino-4-deoxy-L-arabinose transferase-like glycosyltransferase